MMKNNPEETEDNYVITYSKKIIIRTSEHYQPSAVTWITEMRDSMDEGLVFDIKSYRYLDKVSPIQIARMLHLPLQLVKHILKEEDSEIERAL